MPHARQNAAKTFPGSDPSPPAESPDLPGVERSNAAKTFAGSDPNPAKPFPGSTPRPRFTAVYRTAIAEKLDAGLSLQRIWQDLIEEYGYGASYESVKRFVPVLYGQDRERSGRSCVQSIRRHHQHVARGWVY
jgi:hypothetical protein